MPAGGRGSLIKDVPKQAAAPAAPGMNALFSELNKVLPIPALVHVSEAAYAAMVSSCCQRSTC